MKNKNYNSERCFYWQGRENPRSSTDGKILSKNFLVIILASLICLAGIVYVFQINKAATMGYEIKEKETQIKQLQEKEKQLEIKAAQLRSIYISQIKEEQKQIENENQETNNTENEEEKKSFLLTMKKPAQVSFLEIEIEKVIAMK